MINKLYDIVPLRFGFEVGSFQCGVSELDIFFRNYALQSQNSNASRTYVLHNTNTILGYYSVVYGSVPAEKTPSRISRGMGRYPIPVMVLARLAVHKEFQGNGYGEALLKNALKRTINASRIAGLRAMIVVAKNEKAKKFYQKYEFIESMADDFHLYLLIKDILKSLPDEDEIINVSQHQRKV